MDRNNRHDLPTQFELTWPTVLTMRELRGSATNSEISDEVVAREGFTEEQQATRRRPIEDVGVPDQEIWHRVTIVAVNEPRLSRAPVPDPSRRTV